MTPYHFWMVEIQGERETYSRSCAKDWRDLPEGAERGIEGETIFRIWTFSKSWRDAVGHARMVYRDNRVG